LRERLFDADVLQKCLDVLFSFASEAFLQRVQLGGREGGGTGRFGGSREGRRRGSGGGLRRKLKV